MRSRQIAIIAVPVLGALLLAGAWGAGILAPGPSEVPADAARGTMIDVGGDAVPFETVLRTSVSPWSRSGAWLVRDASAYDDLVRRVADPARRNLAAPVLDVDWGREMAIVVAMGETDAADADLRVVEVYRDGSDLRVDVVREAGHRRRGADASAPVHVIRVPRADVDDVAINVLAGDEAPGATRASSWGALKRTFAK